MKTLQVLVLVFVLPVTALLSSVAPARPDTIYLDGQTYAAIAYSPSTGKYGYGNGYRSRFAAEREALWQCPQSDAKVVGWVCNGFLALAVGDDNGYGIGYSYNAGANNGSAMNRALADCRKHTSKNPHIAICICSVR